MGQDIHQAAGGCGGQHLFVVPALDLAVGFTGQNYAFAPGIEIRYFILQYEIITALKLGAARDQAS